MDARRLHVPVQQAFGVRSAQSREDTETYSLLMTIIRGAQVPAVARCLDDVASVIDPLGERAAVVFAAEPAAVGVPSARAIRSALHVGQSRAQRLREYLAAATNTHGRSLAA
jgi:hypothetical protein